MMAIALRGGLVALLALAWASGAYAQSGNADWQMYGKSNLDKAHGGELLFFDAAGVVRRSDGHVEAWTKALPWDELKIQPANDQMTKKFLDFSRPKVLHRRLGCPPHSPPLPKPVPLHQSGLESAEH
jgi:hypothetical protein